MQSELGLRHRSEGSNDSDLSALNPCPAEPGWALPLKTV